MSNLTLANYHRHPAWSPTALKAAVTGTMRAWWHRFGPGAAPFVPSPDMVKGDLVDALLTPPFRIEERFAAFKTIARNTKAGAANCAEAEAAGLTPVSHEMVEQALRIRDALHADPVVGEVLAALDPEASQQPHFWDDEAGRPCRCLPDVVTSDGRLFDLKKTRSAVPRRFYWQAKDLAYDLQIAHLALGHQHRCGSEPARNRGDRLRVAERSGRGDRLQPADLRWAGPADGAAAAGGGLPADRRLPGQWQLAEPRPPRLPSCAQQFQLSRTRRT